MKYFVLAAVAAFSGCAREDHRVVVPEERNCTSSRNDEDNGVLVTCPDGTTTEVHDGQAGVGGIQGARGERGAAGPSGAAGEQGATGAKGDRGEAGPRGETGATGAQGVAGEAGAAGAAGPSGPAGAAGADAVVEVVDPCGDGPGVDEVLLRLNNGVIVGWYFGVGLTRELLVGESYQTTDAQACVFQVQADGQVTWAGME